MQSAARTAGVTAIELLITMAIAAILLAIAVPSYKYVTTSNRMSSEINGLLGDMQFARYEAIKQGVPITICATGGTDACSVGAPWNSGWVVLSPTSPNPTTPLRSQPAFTSGDAVAAALQSISFNREGFANTGLTELTLTDATGNAAYTRCLWIGTSGLLYTGPTTGVTC